MNMLIRWCDDCGHFHWLRRYCLQPQCMCPPVPKWRAALVAPSRVPGEET